MKIHSGWLAAALLLFALLRYTTGAHWRSAVVAGLFAWHPLRVESVAWISERKDVLSGFFFMLTLWLYVLYVKSRVATPAAGDVLLGSIKDSLVNRRSVFYRWSLVCFALGLLAKPMLVTVPFVLLLLDFWPLQRLQVSGFKFQVWLEKIPFFLLTIVSCMITFLVQQKGQAVATLDEIPLGFRLENATLATALYLKKIIWPCPLAVRYPLAPISTTAFVLAMALLLIIFVAAWLGRNRNPCWLFGWLWFLGTLVPVIGIVQVGNASMADRYTYIPSIGIFIALAFGLQEQAKKTSRSNIFLPLGATLMLLGSIGMTEWQLHYWRDTETLFRHALAVTQRNDIAHLDLAITLDQQDRLEEALAEYRETLRLGPDRYKIHFNMGCILGKLSRPGEALAEFREAIRFDPQVAMWHCAAGSELATLGQDDEALKEFAEAERLKSDYAQPHLETAKLFFQQGQDAAAVDQLHAALRAEPDNFQILATIAHYLAAHENTAVRDGGLALTLAIKADDLSGHIQPMVLDTLAMAYAETGNFTNAAACAQNALELAENAKMKAAGAIQKRSELYKNKQPWRESFRATNAPGEN